MIKIKTHSGSFHSDEIFAIALIKTFVDEDVEIERTRNSKDLDKYVSDKDVWVIDVGGVYDPSNLNFDHHQSAFKKSWKNGTPMSSVGIVWEFLITHKFLVLKKSVRINLENMLIKKIDSHDNGVEAWSLSCIFTQYNRDDQNEAYKKFLKAIEVAKDIVENMISQSNQYAVESKKIKDLVKKLGKQEIIVSEEYLSKINNQLSKLKTPKVYIMPTKDGLGNWIAHSVSEGGTGFVSRCLVPESLRGKTVEELTNKGWGDIVFAHKKGFIAVSTSKNGALKMAEAMIESNS
jgi:uncharacterized UPF0160 family protein